MLGKAMEFIEKLPNYMIKEFGRINYEDYAFPAEKKRKGKGWVVKLIVIVGILLLIYRRFRKK